jgi:hypothetical protein
MPAEVILVSTICEEVSIMSIRCGTGGLSAYPRSAAGGLRPEHQVHGACQHL